MTRIPMPAALAALALPIACGARTARAEADPSALRARNQAAACTNCHGPQGRPPADSPIPALAGRSQSELVSRMQAFKAGTRPATVMNQIAKGYSDEQITAIAAWFAAVR
ncbi:cytochrome C [Cupriavidus sp. UYMMa02A]|nr:cytochrome C [Cupriavidus sp. UYMMa02A]